MHKLSLNKVRVVITLGDCAGIGPEIIIKALSKKEILALANFLIVGSAPVLDKARRILKSRFSWQTIRSAREINFSQEPLLLLDLHNLAPSDFVPGKICSTTAKAALEYLQTAVKLLQCGQADILVTAPVCKEAINRIEKDFSGQTEYLADLTKSRQVEMFFVASKLKVALVTRHVALKSVSNLLTKKRIYSSIFLLDAALKKYFGLKKPKIAVCALNPHAGEGGLFGREETLVIKPAINQAKKKHILVNGPLPADTVFRQALQQKFTAVVALYHDQGLAPFKMLFQDEGVNVTLGLEFIRTSPDHGTAFDLAWKNKASSHALECAIKVGIEMFYHAKKNP
jgi:4-hydroxythreonine-4-phosphate dehydrogenase